MITLRNIDGRTTVSELHKLLFTDGSPYSKLYIHSASDGKNNVVHILYDDQLQAQVSLILVTFYYEVDQQDVFVDVRIAKSFMLIHSLYSIYYNSSSERITACATKLFKSNLYTR